MVSALYSHRVNTRFEVVAPTGTDLAMQEFVEPLAACPGSTDVIVAILNAGSEDVDTATIGWTLNGVAQTSVTWTGNIGTGDTAHVNLGSFTSAASTLYNIEAYIQNVGPGLDTNTSNDTIGTAYQAAIDGNFTINPGAPASGTNFQTFEDAIDVLNTFGVCGPVLFEAVADTFNEQVILGDVAGASATNTITFRGAGAGNTVLAFEQNVSDDRYTFRLDGSSYVTLDSMSIVADDNGTYGWGVHMTNGANNITVENCSIVTSTSSTSTFFNGLVISGSNTSYTLQSSDHNDITIVNNTIIGGYNNIRLNGNSSDKMTDVVVENNTFLDASNTGLYLFHVDGIEVQSNYLEARSGTTFGAGIWMSNTDNFLINANEIYKQGQYGIYMTVSGGTSTSPAQVSNNAISGIGNTGNFGSAIRVLGNSNFIDIINNSCLLNSGTGRVFQITVITPDDLRVLNNTFVHTESDGYAMYINNGSVFGQINNNNYFSPGNNFVYYDGADRANLAALQAQNNPTGNDANSVEADPLYVANDNLLPLNGALSGAGTAFAGVTTDITGVARATPPDIGAYEFVPVNADFALISGELINGECLSNDDTVSLQIVHTIGASVNLAVDSIVATFEVSGPATSTGTVVFNTGILTEGDTATAIATGIDLSIPGIYTLNAFIDTNAVNEAPENDTLDAVDHEIRPVFTVDPTSVTITNNQDSVEVTARSPFMPGGDFFITEICHFRGSSNGAPSGGWPSYLIADDYIEITGVPSSDLGGVTLEVWTTTTQNTNYTFPPGTMMSPDGTAIVAVAQLGSSQPSPADFYYHGNGAFTGLYGSATAIGYILKDAGGNIIDACAYSGSTPYVFPAAANVSTADWSGSVPSGTGSAGIRLEGAYTKDATNWLVSSATNPQDPNDVNPSVNVPVPGNVTGLEWTIGGALIDTVPSVFVGPFAVPGTYYATATYQTPCGPQTDSVEIIVDFPYCFDPDSIMVMEDCDEVDVSWVSGALTVHSDIEYGPAGFTPGSGTLVSGVTSPVTITGLTPTTDYDMYILDSCGSSLTPSVGVSDVIEFTTQDAAFAGIDFVDNGSGNYDFFADTNTVGNVRWEFGDGNDANGDSVNHTYASPGTYTVLMIAENNCGSDTATLTINYVSVDAFGLNDISIYPNPSRGEVVVDQLPVDGGKVIMMIHDVAGQNVFSKVCPLGTDRVDMDLTHLSAGTYFISLSNDHGRTTKSLIIVK